MPNEIWTLLNDSYSVASQTRSYIYVVLTLSLQDSFVTNPLGKVTLRKGKGATLASLHRC
jgi:hypothetical protein